AAPQCGKALPFRLVEINILEAMPPIPEAQPRKDESYTRLERRSLSTLCGGKAACSQALNDFSCEAGSTFRLWPSARRELKFESLNCSLNHANHFCFSADAGFRGCDDLLVRLRRRLSAAKETAQPT